MAIGANSYGSVAEVAALVGRYTSSGSFTASTRPTEAQVEKFIDRVSGIMNVLLAREGFEIPVSQADSKLALDEFVVEQAHLLAHAANGAGPYSPGSQVLRRTTVSRVIMRDAELFIESNAIGFERLGVPRTYKMSYGLEARLEDDGGDPIVPVFQRKMIGNVIVDWGT